MKKPTRRTKLALCMLLTVSALSTGCEPIGWVGPNLTIGINVPFGLAGSPGLLNPFGIVQALVNSALGISPSGTGTTTPFPTPPTTNIGTLTPALGGTINPPQPGGF